MDSDRVSPELIDVAVAAAAPIERFYVRSGGSVKDLRTDLSYVCEAVLEALVNGAPPPAARRRPRAPLYSVPDRRTTCP